MRYWPSMERLRRWRAPASIGLLVAVPTILIVAHVGRWIVADDSGGDLRIAYLGGAHAILDGRSLFPGLQDPAVAAGTAYVYPPLLAFLTVPLTVVSGSVAVALGMVVAAILVPVILLIAGVRDYRCIGAAMLWAPVSNEVQTVNVSILVALLLAIAWRTRDRHLPSGLAIGGALALKLFGWPLLVWPFAMRRVRASLIGTAFAAALILGSWAAIGFAGFTGYPALLDRLAHVEASHSYSLVGAAAALGLGDAVGKALALLLMAGLVAWCLITGRQGDDRRSFAAAALAAIAFAPIVWLHYFLLLLVALAVTRPRFSAVWLLPLLMWLSPQAGNGTWYQTIIVVGAATGVAVACLRQPHGSQLPSDTSGVRPGVGRPGAGGIRKSSTSRRP